MPAEWLHRCAYSWGGLTDEPRSSQAPKNLIFGTGECNSIMTRYEKAWQALVCREGERYKPNRNDSQQQNQAKNGGGTLAANINREKYSTRFGFDSIKQPLTSDEQLAQLPHWLCYALNYELMQKEPVGPLNNQKNFKTVFFPWQRGFFTKFEQILDEAILDVSYDRWYKNNKGWKSGQAIKDVSLLEKRSKLSDGPGDEESTIIKGRPNKAVKTDSSSDTTHGSMKIQEETAHPNPDSLGGHFHRRAAAQTFDPLFKAALVDTVSTLKVSEPISREIAQDEAKSNVSQSAGGDTESTANDAQGITERSIIDDSHIKQLDFQHSWMKAIWDDVHTPGPTLIDGILLSNATVVVQDTTRHDNLQVEDNNLAKDVDVDTEKLDWTAISMVQSITDLESHTLIVQSGATEEFVTLNEPAQQLMEAATPDSVQPPSQETDRLVNTMGATFSRAFPMTDQVQQTQPTASPNTKAPEDVPDMFVVQSPFLLFGKHKAQLYSLKNVQQTSGQLLRVIMPEELSLGTFMPSLAGSDLDGIALRNTTVTYRSRGRLAGLMLTTTIALSGVLQPVNLLLRDVFGQTTPHIDATALFGSALTASQCLTQVPQPLGFTLRGELPEVNIPDLFGVLTVTYIGVDVTGRRLGSSGGYELGYGFFGRGHVSDATQVEWNINKFGDQWSISIYTISNDWKNVAGIDGVDVSVIRFPLLVLL